MENTTKFKSVCFGCIDSSKQDEHHDKKTMK